MYDKFYDVFLPQPMIWKDVKGFEGYYQVSNYGLVRSLPREVTYHRQDRDVIALRRGRILKPSTDKDGYRQCTLQVDGKAKHYYVHQLVLFNFSDKYDKDLIVDHIDEVKTHNFLWNLQYLTSTQNTIKHYKLANYQRGVKGLSNLTEQEVKDILYLYKAEVPYEYLVNIFHVRQEEIYKLVSGTALRSVSKVDRQSFYTRESFAKHLDRNKIEAILSKRLIQGNKVQDLADEYHVSTSTITRLCTGQRHYDILRNFKEKHGL